MHLPASTILALPGQDEPIAATNKLRGMGVVLFVHVVVRAWQVQRFDGMGEHSLALAALSSAVGLVGVGTIGVAGRQQLARASAAWFLFLLLLQVAISFPLAPNHLFLECVLFGLMVAYLDGSPDSPPLLLAALRWIAVLVLMWTGIQKWSWGTWDHGEFLAAAIREKDSFATFFAWLPSEEIDRLRALGEQPGDGPYRVASPLALVISNLTWVLEIALPLAMLRAQTRAIAVRAAIALVFLIELAAREFFFGLLFVSLLLVVPDGDRITRWVPAFLLAYGTLALSLAGILEIGPWN